jgi:hypothetical protein
MALCKGCREDDHGSHSSKVHLPRTGEQKGRQGARYSGKSRVVDCECPHCSTTLSRYLDPDVHASGCACAKCNPPARKETSKEAVKI